MAAKKVDRDQPPPGRASNPQADRVDTEHPKRSLPPVRLSARPLADAIEELKAFHSLDAPVVSLYWSVPADLGKLKGAVSMLRDLAKPVRERAASDKLPHAARMSLLADADRILELEPLVPKLQGRTLAFFRCDAHGFEEAVLAPSDLPDLVRLDATPFVRPLLGVLDEGRRYAVVVVDREHGWLFDFYLGELEVKKQHRDRVLREPKFAAGDKEDGGHHKAQELAKHHYRDTAAALQELVQDQGIELIVVSGHKDSTSAFLAQLPDDLRQKVIGTFVIDPHTMTPASARDAAQKAVDAYERGEDEQLVAHVLERVAAGGLGAAGLDWCLMACVELAIEHLLVDDGVTVAGRVCDTCTWLGSEGDECPVDGSPTRATTDVIDEMAVRVLDSSGHVRHVRADTPLHDHAVAALLRFPVNRP